MLINYALKEEHNRAKFDRIAFASSVAAIIWLARKKVSILLNHKNVIHEVRVSGTGRYKYTCKCDRRKATTQE